MALSQRNDTLANMRRQGAQHLNRDVLKSMELRWDHMCSTRPQAGLRTHGRSASRDKSGGRERCNGEGVEQLYAASGVGAALREHAKIMVREDKHAPVSIVASGAHDLFNETTSRSGRRPSDAAFRLTRDCRRRRPGPLAPNQKSRPMRSSLEALGAPYTLPSPLLKT
jgi:hypothetical protein